MKNKLLKILLCFCMAMVVMGGCGSDTEATLADGTVTIEEDQTTQESVEQSTEDITKESTKDATEESIEEPVEESAEEPVEELSKDWFSEHGLVITPQGDFTFITMSVSVSNWVDVGTFEVKANAVITETTDGVEDGYKKVTMVWNLDISAASAEHAYWALSFDRYTGTAFAFDSSPQYTDYGGTSSRENFVTIVNGDDSYEVSVLSETVNNAPNITKTITVTCPADYDGVVFYIGYNDLEINDAYGAIDLTEKLYTIDELPAYGDGYYYFSYSNE